MEVECACNIICTPLNNALNQIEDNQDEIQKTIETNWEYILD